MKRFALLLTLAVSCYFINAQVPQGFNYQAIARGSDGKEIANTTIQVQISILSDTSGFKAAGGGTYVWEEQQSVTTNALGLFTLVVGNPSASRIRGSAATFSAINWKPQPLYIGTKINYNSTWRIMGAAQLLSVPYSMVTGEIAGSVSKLAVSGTTSSLDEALFEVKNKNGQTVFAVYNEGVRAYVDNGGKGRKGGFAIGSFGTDKGTSDPLFVVNADSIRAYIKQNPVKGLKGGFAIGSFDPAKAYNYEEYLQVTRDSSRIYVNNYGKGTKGGFAIGGFGTAKGDNKNFMNLTPNNYFIGHLAGNSNTTGLYNSYLGYQSGFTNKTGNYNTFMGYEAGYTADASYNTFIGYMAGRADTWGDGNVFIGYNSGLNSTIGYRNVFVGYNSGQYNVSGYENTFIGGHAGYGFNGGSANIMLGTYSGNYFYGGNNNIFIGNGSGYGIKFSTTLANNNIFVGTSSGRKVTTGGDNAFIGTESGFNNSSGSYNTFLGFQSGYSNTIGYNNVFMGNQAGFSNNTGYNNVIMGTSAGFYNSSGFSNTFIGNLAGYANTTGFFNIFIGEQSGVSNTSASRNVFLGQFAGRYNTTGEANVFIGQQTGEANTTGSFNLYAGRAAGNFNTTGQANTFLGINAGNVNTTGNENVYLGGESGKLNSTGSYNVNLGTGSGYSNADGNYNIIIGYYAGVSLSSGSSNIFIGPGAGGGLSNTSGKLFIENSAADINNALIYGDFSSDYLKLNANVDIRNRLNFNNSGQVLFVNNSEALWYDGSAFSWGFGGVYNYFARKVTIGNGANPSNMLYVQDDVISNDNPAILGQHNVTPFYGVGVKGVGGYIGVRGESTFAGAGARFGVFGNASGGVSNYGIYGTASGTDAWAAYFNGNVYVLGSVTQTSDRNLKKNILPISGSLKKVLALQGVTYEWKSGSELAATAPGKNIAGKESESQSFNFPKGVQFGVIAQEVEAVLPNLVYTDANGFKSIDYIRIIPLLIEAIKEQQQQIGTYESLLQSLQERVEQIEGMIARSGVK